MKNLKYIIVMIALLAIAVGCKKDDNSDPSDNGKGTLSLEIKAPEKMEIAKYKTITFTFTELNTAKTTVKTYENTNAKVFNFAIPHGSYEVKVDAKAQYKFNNEEKEGDFSAFINKVDLNTAAITQQVDLSLKLFGKDFIIEEIFYNGTLTPENKQYIGDQYIKLYNNTEKTLYADGLLFADSRFLTSDTDVYTPDIMKEAFTTEGIVQIPGDGTKYPVKPGEYIIIAEQGINHKEKNSNSVDLSKANFENFYPNMKDVDNPQVTNTIVLYEKLIFHNRGYRSYVIARLPKGMTSETFLKDYKYEYSYKTVAGIKTRDAMKIPNEWIVDAVNLCSKDDFKRIVTDPSLDSGWSYSGLNRNDKDRYGKSVRRKVLSENGGKPIFQDTNNSTDDFVITAPPTMFK